jgi:hypothetical protein
MTLEREARMGRVKWGTTACRWAYFTYLAPIFYAIVDTKTIFLLILSDLLRIFKISVKSTKINKSC